MGDLERMSLMRVAIDRLPFGIPTKGGAPDFRLWSPARSDAAFLQNA